MGSKLEVRAREVGSTLSCHPLVGREEKHPTSGEDTPTSAGDTDFASDDESCIFELDEEMPTLSSEGLAADTSLADLFFLDE
mmetsp:Transcript_6988/g.19258  ORF Transcript_6988/g.19258 Transcript_6988/m.19258 type:complete len:82 (-) Transcript_6988:217-462(-)